MSALGKENLLQDNKERVALKLICAQNMKQKLGTYFIFLNEIKVKSGITEFSQKKKKRKGKEIKT